MQAYFDTVRACTDYKLLITDNKPIIYPFTAWILEQGGLYERIKLILSDIQDLNTEQVYEFTKLQCLCPYGLRSIAELIGADIGGPEMPELMIGFADEGLIKNILQYEQYCLEVEQMVNKLEVALH